MRDDLHHFTWAKASIPMSLSLLLFAIGWAEASIWWGIYAGIVGAMPALPVAVYH